MMMAWQCTPHSLFCEKRECAVHGGREKTGARKSCGLFDTQVPTRGIMQAGVLEVDAKPVRLSSLPLTWRWRKSIAP